MKTAKKFLCGLLAISSTLMYAVPVMANDINVVLNGNTLEFDVPPQLIDNRTLVPMRAIFEAMGCEVEWDDGTIDVWKDDENIMTLWVGENTMWTPDNLITLDVPPQILNDRTLVPVRAITESIGATVDWVQASKLVTITYVENSDTDNTSDTDETSESTSSSSSKNSLTTSSSSSKNNSSSSSTCKHKNTSEVCQIDFRTFENTGDASVHNVIDDCILVCDDCGETIKTGIKTTITDTHNFKNGVCTACGYKKATVSGDECTHPSTTNVCNIDINKYENTGSSSTHGVKVLYTVECDDCREEIKEFWKDAKDEEHEFEDGVCIKCGYTKTSSSSSSSGSLSENTDGAFTYITVPAGKCIEIPNNSNGSLKITMDGVYNAAECTKDGKYKTQDYNTKDKSGSISIKSTSYAIVQNSGNSDLTVSIPSEYAAYSETNQKVYETFELSEGDSAEITAMQQDKVYFDSTSYEYLEYNEDLLYACGRKGLGSKQDSISTKYDMRITATNNLEIVYSPLNITISSTNQTAFQEISAGSGKTATISATDNSKTFVFTDGSSSYDYVIYGNDGKVKSQKQNVHGDSISIGKNCYMDFTNTSSHTVTIKVPTLYCSVEQY